MSEYHPETPRGCPPKDATPAIGVYYRFVFNNPPISEDFVIWILEPANNHLLAERKRKRHCQSFAVSVFGEEGQQRKVALFGPQMRKKAQKRGTNFVGIAQVRLDEDSGVIMQTGRDYHYDLWPYITCRLENNVISIRGI